MESESNKEIITMKPEEINALDKKLLADLKRKEQKNELTTQDIAIMGSLERKIQAWMDAASAICAKEQ